jgi:23S rRNA (cytidine2498-2'-O)-methyltransferase
MSAKPFRPRFEVPAGCTAVLLYCRPGFENECAGEICAVAGGHGVDGYARTKPDTGYVLFTPHETERLPELATVLHIRDLIYARQFLFVAPMVGGLPVDDRATPLAQAILALGRAFSALWLETADTNEAKELATFLKKFEKPLVAALQSQGVKTAAPGAPRLHLFFLSSAAAYAGISDPYRSAPWPLGIPRLRSPRGAPSRSTQKLAEAFIVFDLERLLRAGQTAVDLGAAPGGWSFQFAQREIHVTAIDNGNMDPALMATGLVEHIKADGFHWRPKRGGGVDWLVCDMVEKPARIAQLMADWVAQGRAQHAIFNLKLPMKKRREEVERCFDLIDARLEQAGRRYEIKARQLYHDREEITVYLRPL